MKECRKENEGEGDAGKKDKFPQNHVFHEKDDGDGRRLRCRCTRCRRHRRSRARTTLVQ